MYHLDAINGESPDLATVKEAPFESYDGEPWVVNESEAPDVKSMVTSLPNAVSGGQLPTNKISKDGFLRGGQRTNHLLGGCSLCRFERWLAPLTKKMQMQQRGMYVTSFSEELPVSGKVRRVAALASCRL